MIQLFNHTTNLFNLHCCHQRNSSDSPSREVKIALCAILRDLRAPKRILFAFCVHSRNSSAPCLNCYILPSVPIPVKALCPKGRLYGLKGRIYSLKGVTTGRQICFFAGIFHTHRSAWLKPTGTPLGPLTAKIPYSLFRSPKGNCSGRYLFRSRIFIMDVIVRFSS